jgi:hypothetical protein
MFDTKNVLDTLMRRGAKHRQQQGNHRDFRDLR